MGSLPINGNAMSKFVSIPSSGTNSFRERSKNRSPIQSPPLPKRILHFLETGKLGPKISSNERIGRHAGNHDAAGRNKENRPILKSSGAGSSHRRARSTCADHNRKVSFRAKVVVFHFDREQGGHVHCESQTLNNEPDAKTVQQQQLLLHRQNSNNGNNSNALTTFVSSSSSVATQRSAHGGSFPTNRNDSNGTPTTQRRSLPPLQRNHREESSSFPAPSVVLVKDLNFQYSVDESRNSVLRFSLPLGQGTSAGDVVVKANKNGDRIRVFSNSSSSSSSSGGSSSGDPGAAAATGPKCREICERFALPVRVDSYRINARIDAGGMLFVEAPILSTESLPPPTRNQAPHI